MGYAFEESPEELKPQPSGNRSGGPPRHRTTIDLVDRPDESRRSLPIPFKRISQIIGLALLLLAVGLLLVNIVWPR